MPRAYYNEFKPEAAVWLEELIRQGHLPAGDVDTRSIEDVRPDDLKGYTQCHFFAGIGGWAYALRLAGWPDDRPVWTGSCPCQPFSAAGKGDGFDDPRHLWPAWYWLIAQCLPERIYGEQVATGGGMPWLDLVHADLEALGYAVGAVPAPASGFGAPQMRPRTYFVGHLLGMVQPYDPRLEGHARHGHRATGWAKPVGYAAVSGGAGGVDDTTGPRQDRSITLAEVDSWHEAWMRVPDAGRDLGGVAHSHCDVASVSARSGSGSGEAESRWSLCEPERHDHTGGMAHSCCEGRWEVTGSASGDETTNGRKGRNGCEPDSDHVAASDGADSGVASGFGGPVPQSEWGSQGRDGDTAASHLGDPRRPGPTNGFWRDADWLFCRDGKWRPVESSVLPVADGLPEGVGHLWLDRAGTPQGAPPPACYPLAQKVRHRTHLLEGYGNAIVPQHAAQFIRAADDAIGYGF